MNTIRINIGEAGGGGAGLPIQAEITNDHSAEPSIRWRRKGQVFVLEQWNSVLHVWVEVRCFVNPDDDL